MNPNPQIQKIKKALQNRAVGIQDARGIFAVLLLLVEKPDGLHLLFEFRAATVKPQPSETCFPGGRVEPGETPREAALRETWEEIGLPPTAVEILAPLDILQDISGRVIHPFLGYITEETLKTLRLNEAEVKEVFLIPLDYLRQNEPYLYVSPLSVEVGDDFPYEKIGFPEGYRWRSGTVDIPVYEYEGHQVWGLTGRLLRWLLGLLEEKGL